MKLIRTILINKIVKKRTRYIFKRAHIGQMENNVLHTPTSGNPVHLQKFIKLPYYQAIEKQTIYIFKVFHLCLAWHSYHSTSYLLSKLKDPIDKNMLSGIVYGNRCRQSTSVYLGATSRYLKKRIY